VIFEYLVTNIEINLVHQKKALEKAK